MLKKTLIATAMLAASSASMAEITANIAASSDYFFRGVSQTDGEAAVSGGLDWDSGSGFYLGTWASNVSFADAEVDLYGGYAGETGGGLGYDLGVLYYYYPGDFSPSSDGDLDYAELAAGLSMGMFSGGIAYTFYGEVDDAPFDDGDLYYHVGMELPLQDSFSLGLLVGYYDFDTESSTVESYTHWAAKLTKDVGEFGSFNMAYEQTDDDLNDDEPNIWLGWSKEF